MTTHPTEPTPNADGLSSVASPYPVGETLDRLEAILQATGATIFARIDHHAAAKHVGLTMHPAQVLVFGNPRVGTPVMNASPTIAIDLPFKALAWEDTSGHVWLSYNDVDFLAHRHHVPAGLTEPLRHLGALIAEAVR